MYVLCNTTLQNCYCNFVYIQYTVPQLVKSISYILTVAIKSIPTENDMGKNLQLESKSFQKDSATDIGKNEALTEFAPEMILAAKSVHIKFLNITVQLNKILQNCDSQLFLEACNKLYAYVSDSKTEPLFPSNYIVFLDKIEKQFKRLSFLWSWYNCSILRALLEACNCQDGLSLLDEFESQIDLNQPMELFPIPRLSSKMAPLLSTTYTLLSIRSEQYHNQLVPLRYMRKVATILVEALRISQQILQPLAVQPAPLIMHWMIPKCIVPHINKEIHKYVNLLRSNGILEITTYPNIALYLDSDWSLQSFSNDHLQVQ